MKGKSIFGFLIVGTMAIVIISFSWIFLNREAGSAQLQERMISGDCNAAEGLAAAFRADSADDIHWLNEYDFSGREAKSSFSRGIMSVGKAEDTYRDFRFTGWRREPYYIHLQYDELGKMQEKRIHEFYDDLQRQSKAAGKPCRGTIRLKDYIDYYPVNFRFQFGEKIYNSAAMLQGLKTFDDRGELTEENTEPYQGDLELYKVLNENFRIPVIDNEYQQYRISPDGKTKLSKPLGADKDFYEFDPIIVLQQENIKDGTEWKHPDTKSGIVEDKAKNDVVSASEYGYKNRMLFIVNNRTAKGKPVDVSEIRDGFGIYELPIDSAAGITIGKGRKNLFIPDPKPLTDRLAMVCPLDRDAEYVEMALSGDHRQLVLFFIKEDNYYVEIFDADTWESILKERIFPASEKMAYGWGDDDSFAVSDCKEHIAVFTKNGKGETPYKLLYKGRVPENIARDYFAAETVAKEHSYCKYEYGIDEGLAIAAKADRAALINNSLIGDSGYKNPDLMCAVIDNNGLAYEGLLQSNLVDADSSVTGRELKKILMTDDAELLKYMIKPVPDQNQAGWKR
ncbi:MAG: hypothetical protein MSH28_01935 [Clostridiales bacterium]|nr:hypothetical protein [Clostridiales bacterium]